MARKTNESPDAAAYECDQTPVINDTMRNLLYDYCNNIFKHTSINSFNDGSVDDGYAFTFGSLADLERFLTIVGYVPPLQAYARGQVPMGLTFELDVDANLAPAKIRSSKPYMFWLTVVVPSYAVLAVKNRLSHHIEHKRPKARGLRRAKR